MFVALVDIWEDCISQHIFFSLKIMGFFSSLKKSTNTLTEYIYMDIRKRSCKFSTVFPVYNRNFNLKISSNSGVFFVHFYIISILMNWYEVKIGYYQCFLQFVTFMSTNYVLYIKKWFYLNTKLLFTYGRRKYPREPYKSDISSIYCISYITVHVMYNVYLFSNYRYLIWLC